MPPLFSSMPISSPLSVIFRAAAVTAREQRPPQRWDQRALKEPVGNLVSWHEEPRRREFVRVLR